MEKKFDPRGKERKRTNRKKWYKAVCSLAAAVVVCTVYTLMLPALTLDEKSAGDVVTISESSVATSEAPAAESSRSDNGSESQNDTAADSSADSSHAAAESGPAAAAPSDDRAPSTTEPTTEGEHNAPVTLPTEETNNGAITGSSESHDEVTSPDTDDQEKIKDEENNGSPAADKEETDEEEADNSGSSTDADTEEDDSEKSDDTADVETASDWEKTIPDLSDCETWAEKLLAVAQSQLGYKESVLNFTVGPDGEHKGYTRYGAWNGNPYGDWCAMFVSFCLNYAGIDKDIVPQNENCSTWMSDLDDRGLFNDAETYVPEEGDIVFFRQHSKTKADYIGIVKEVQLGTKEVTQHFMSNGKSIESGAMNLLSYLDELGIDSDMSVTPDSEEPVLTTETVEVTVAESITVIEGDSADKVNEVTYNLPDDTVLGFVSMGDAEYVHDGGSLEDKNAALDAPATLEEKIELTAVATKTIAVGETTELKGHERYTSNWESTNNSIATVEMNNNYSYIAKVKGIKQGKATIKHTYKYYDYERTYCDEWDIVVTSGDRPAKIFYLNTPTSDPDSNNPDQWGKELGTSTGQLNAGLVNVDNATWINDKNIFEDINNHVVSWPDGTQHSTLGSTNPDNPVKPVNYGWKLEKNTYYYDDTKNNVWKDHWKVIFDAFKSDVEKNLGVTITEDDVSSIYLVPYKISTNDDGYHIDCKVNIICKNIYNATFWVIKPDGTIEQVDSKNYKTADNIQKTANNPAENIVYNGITYKLDENWYTEAGKNDAFNSGKINNWPYDPVVKEGTINIYTRYIPQSIGINYQVGKGEGSLDSYNETLTNGVGSVGSIPTPADGYVFEGWYTDSDCSETHKITTEGWIGEDGKITPQPDSNGSWENIPDGTTYYAKFTSGVALPETGGPGTTLLYLLGAMLITAPLTITFIKRRRQEEEEN